MKFTQILLLIGFAGASLLADDWPQFQGPTRDGIWRETGILTEFPAGGLKTTWRADVAGGYSGPAVAEGRVFVTDYVTDGDKTPDSNTRNSLTGTERVLCFAESSGDLIWKHEYSRNYEISYPAGPRATPTIDGPHVYVLGAEGDLICLRVDNGDVVWSRQLKEDYEAESPQWGYAAHPLIVDDTLFTLAGGQGSIVIALNKLTGEEIWRALSAEEIGYSPPTLIKAGGTRQLLVWHPESLNSLDPVTGKVYWTERLKPDYGMSIAPPYKVGNFLYVGGIKNKSMVLRLDGEKPAAELVWLGKNKLGVAPSHCPVIMSTDMEHLFGIDRGGLRCVNLASGEIVWEDFSLMENRRRADAGTGFMVRNGNRHFILSETGELVIAKLSPAGYEEIDRTKPLVEKTHDAFGRAVLWSPPAFANGAIFVRNDKELIRVELK